MKKVYRFENNVDYWERRWQESEKDADSFTNLNIYPIRYANMLMQDKNNKSLEIGCGLGRVLKHYHYQGYDITGIERSEVAVNRIRKENPAIKVTLGDVKSLDFADKQFDVVMAFGVYHNLDTGIEQALGETARVLKTGGRFCISMRPDNWEMRFNELYWRWQKLKINHATKQFHKLLVNEKEFKALLSQFNLAAGPIYRAKNVSILYRIPWLQCQRALSATETARRSTGYQLNRVGNKLERVLTTLFEYQTCNVLVFIGDKR